MASINTDNLSAHHSERLHAKAYQDQAVRSFPGTWIYLLLFSIILSITPYYQDHRDFVLLLGGVISVATFLRLVCTFRFAKWYARNRMQWIISYIIGTLTLALAWGVLSMHAVLNYGLEWTAMLVLLTTAGVAAGATNNISIHLKLVVAYLTLMLLPFIIALVIQDTSRSLGVAAVFLISYLVLIGVAKRLSKEYWSGEHNAVLLERRASEMEELNRELEAFAYSVSHDLRAPLRVIDGFSHALSEDLAGKLEGEHLENLHRIRRSSQKLGQLIEEILQLSRIGRSELKQDKANLSNLVQTTVEKLQKAHPERNVEMCIKESVVADGDPILLGQVIDNLIDNAWKYTGKCHHPRIEFGTEIRDSTLSYYIKDNGVGFDMRFAEKIFNVFHRLHNDAAFPGTGVGLAIVQRIIHRHGGRIWAESVPNEGATFYFTLGDEAR